MICFSKDRPLQLHGYLTSLYAQWSGEFTVSVLVKSESPYQGAYAEVAAAFPQVTWCNETDFGSDLGGLIGDAEFTCFGCDDALYVRPVVTSHVEAAFDALPLLGLSLRLGMHVSEDMWGTPLSQPRFESKGTWLAWDAARGVGDWGYPWEVLGTVYRTAFAKSVVSSLNAGSPSQLEERGWRTWRDHTALSWMAAYSTLRLVVPTVNVVQNEFPNGIRGRAPLEPEFLLDCWNHGLRADTERYSGMQPASWRVPNFYMRRAA